MADLPAHFIAARGARATESDRSRREFLRSGVALVVAMLVTPRLALAAARGMRAPLPHPTPRAGITSAKVMTKEDLAAWPDIADAFEGVRAIPEIIDGIRCNCGCAGQKGFYSLLTCYEAPAMALFCPICQGEGRMAARLHKAGKSLDEIRAAIDAKYS